jgi:hypothetical protein
MQTGPAQVAASVARAVCSAIANVEDTVSGHTRSDSKTDVSGKSLN